MKLAYRVDVKKSITVIVLEYSMGGSFAGNDLTEYTGIHDCNIRDKRGAMLHSLLAAISSKVPLLETDGPFYETHQLILKTRELILKPT